jgi:hypothetical protein
MMSPQDCLVTEGKGEELKAKMMEIKDKFLALVDDEDQAVLLQSYLSPLMMKPGKNPPIKNKIGLILLSAICLWCLYAYFQ